jgi:DNA-binding transcriptional regulator GbsR (MarR family)
MPTFSDGQDTHSSTMSDFLAPGVPSIGDMRAHLQLLLDNKEKQLQQVGTLGQRILSQQVQLDERVRQLHELEAELDDNQDLDSEIRERYRELTEMVKSWDVDNTQLTQSFDPIVRPLFRSFSDPEEN